MFISFISKIAIFNIKFLLFASNIATNNFFIDKFYVFGYAQGFYSYISFLKKFSLSKLHF